MGHRLLSKHVLGGLRVRYRIEWVLHLDIIPLGFTADAGFQFRPDLCRILKANDRLGLQDLKLLLDLQILLALPIVIMVTGDFTL